MRIRLVFLALCGTLAPLHAQDVVQLTPATRLRVSAASPLTQVHTGTYRGLTDTALVLSRDTSQLTIPLAGITQVELSRGRQPNVTTGIVGLLLGAAAGGAIGCAANSDDYGVYCGGQDDTKVIVGAALGAAAGATLGALLFRRERWSVVDGSRLRTDPPLGSPRYGS
jgi:hypothetical protein